MKPNGSGQTTVGKWTQIPATKKHHSTPIHSHHHQYYLDNNPYEVLSDSSIHNLTKLVLPNGELIFSSYHSIEAISTYFLEKIATHKIPANLASSTLNKNENVKPSQTSHHEKRYSNDKFSHNKKKKIKIVWKQIHKVLITQLILYTWAQQKFSDHHQTSCLRQTSKKTSQTYKKM